MTAQIDVYADYVCPYCLLAEKVLSEALADQDAEIKWHPFELRPDPIPTLRVEDPYLPKIWARSVYPLAEKLGQDISLPIISPQPRTALAFQAFAFAEDHELGYAFSMRTMKAFFRENRDIGEMSVLAGIGVEVGLDPDTLREALTSGRYTEQHAESLRHAIEDLAIRAVPTIIIGRIRLEGMPNVKAIRDAVKTLEVTGETIPLVGSEQEGCA